MIMSSKGRISEKADGSGRLNGDKDFTEASPYSLLWVLRKQECEAVSRFLKVLELIPNSMTRFLNPCAWSAALMSLIYEVA